MNNLRILLLIFNWSIPFYIFLGGISLFYNDQFLGVWILSPWDYPLSHSILLSVAFSCAAILNFALGKIRKNIKLTSILLGILLGLATNICLVVFGFIQLCFNIFNDLYLYLVLARIPPLFLKVLLAFSLLVILWYLFNFLNKQLNDEALKVTLVILIIFLPFLPMTIPLLIGSFIGCELSSVKREGNPCSQSFLHPYWQIFLIIFAFIWIIKINYLPGLTVSPIIRNIWGITAFNSHYYNYKQSTKKLLDCQPIKDKIGEIKSIALVEGKNYIIDDGFAPGGEAIHLNTQLVREQGTAIAIVCFGSGDCFPHLHGLKRENENKAKIFTQSEVKTVDISKCIEK